jgi:hypothetical protein
MTYLSSSADASSATVAAISGILPVLNVHAAESPA